MLTTDIHTETDRHTNKDEDTHTQTHIHTDQTQKSDFRIQGTSKCVNPSKSSFRKFDPKTILSLLIGKRK